MGAWFVRDPRRPHFVGFGYEALCAAIRNGEVGRDAIVRGPSTRQLWTLARRVPGLAHLFGRCYACQVPLAPDEPACRSCGATTSIDTERNFFGLPAVEPISPPANAKPDLGAFVLDAGLLVVRSVPVRSPARTVVRVAQPVIAAQPVLTAQVGAATTTTSATASTEFVPDFVRSASDEQSNSAAGQPAMTQASVSSSMHRENQRDSKRDGKRDEGSRSALSPIDRGLIERARRLESRNTLLLGTSAASLAFALLFGFAYFLEKEDRAKAVDAARREGAEGVRAEFKRSTPVVVPPPAELPSMPADPGTGVPRKPGGTAQSSSSKEPDAAKSGAPADGSSTGGQGTGGQGTGSQGMGGSGVQGSGNAPAVPTIPRAPAFGSQPSPRRGV